MELELGSDQGSVMRLLSFLKMSFSGGTDVDAPLALSLDRLGEEGWELVSCILMTMTLYSAVMGLLMRHCRCLTTVSF